MYVELMLKTNAHENSTPKGSKINISSSLHNKILFSHLYYFLILIISLRNNEKMEMYHLGFYFYLFYFLLSITMKYL